ncbi:MAG: outer membrane protein assembly factor BamA [Bacteroidales bacterium]|nr:outer membrane protein assembly factor BamA [Bacteroidales bacterium]
MFKRNIYLFLVFITSSLIALAQENVIDLDYYTPKEYEVGDIVITGADNLDENSVILLSGITKGQKIYIPSDKFSVAIDKLWKQGIFDEIHIYITKVEGRTVFLEYNLKTKPRLSYFKFTGTISRSEADKVKEKLHIALGDVVTENMKNNCKNIINEFFMDKGYYLTQTEIIEERDTLSSRKESHLIFNVDKGKKIKIGKINIEGNEFLTDSKIKKQMKNTKEKHWWRPWKSAHFKEEEYKEDLTKIISKYNNEGYRDARITFDTFFVNTRPVKKGFFTSIGRGVAHLFGKKKNKTVDEMVINMNVFEGKKFYFRNITWVGNTKYTSDYLTKLLRINKGDAYNRELLEKNVNYDPTGKDISSLYMDDGYLFFRVIPTELNVENDSIDIEMRIYEGNQARIGNVSISGNTSTRDFVVLRELKTIPGELFSRDDVIRSVREISQLGFFNAEKINPKVEPNAASGTVDIEYQVEESRAARIEAQGGWGGYGRAMFTIGLSLDNFASSKFFDPKEWRPFPVGDGQKISLRLNTNGSYYHSASFSFTEPWLGGRRPNALSFGAYFSYQDDSYYNTSDVKNYYLSIFGAYVSLGQRLQWPDDYFSLVQGIRFKRYSVKNWTTFIMPTGTSNDIAYTLTFGRNSVDQFIYPRSGSEMSLDGAFTFPYSLVNGKDYSKLDLEEKYKWLEYYKINMRFAWYFNVIDDLVFSARSRFGFLGKYNNKLDYSPFDRYYLGGDGLTGYSLDGRELVALRGYSNSALTGQNGATVFDKFTMDLRYPITLNPNASVYVLAFMEGGNSWADFKGFAPFTMYRSAGVGIRVFMSMFGMLGLDWGYGFDPAYGETQRSGGQFHISLQNSID